MFRRRGRGGDFEDRDLRRLDSDLRQIVIEERESYAAELRAELAREHARLRDEHWSRRRSWPAARVAATVLLVLSGSLAVPGARDAVFGLFQPESPVEEAPALRSVPPRPNRPMMTESPLTDPEPRPERPAPAMESPDERPIRTPVPATLPTLLDVERARLAVAQEYPALLQRRGIGGRVALLMWVRENGTVEFPQIASTSGVRELDLAALRATQTLSFAPATRLGDPVGTWVSFSIRFQPGGTDLVQSDSEDAGFHIALSN